MKPVDIQLDTYVDFPVESDRKKKVINPIEEKMFLQLIKLKMQHHERI